MWWACVAFASQTCPSSLKELVQINLPTMNSSSDASDPRRRRLAMLCCSSIRDPPVAHPVDVLMLLEQAATILDQRASKHAASREAEQQPLQVDSDEVAFLEKALARARQAAEAAQRGLDALFLETSDDHEELETATWAGAIDNEPPTPIVSRLSRHSISINLPPSSPDNHHGSVRLKRLMLNAVRATRAFESSLSLGSLSITSSAIDAEEELLGRPITLENALDIFNIQGKKVVGLIDCVVTTPRPWDTPAALKTIAKAAAELLPPMGGELDKGTRERREAEHSANVGKHLVAAEALLASSDPELVLNLLRRVVELSPGWNFDASGRIDSAPSLGAAQHGHKTDRATPTPTAPPPLPTAPPPPPLAAATAATAWAPAKDGSNPLLPRAQTAPATLSAGATGIVQVAAMLTASGVPRAQRPPDQPSVSQREAHAIRHLAFCHLPYSHITFEDVSRMRKALFCRAPEIDPPHAIVTVGPPGCGKSFLMNTRQGQADFAGLPPLDCFATIDPDETVHFICGGKGQPVNPASRPLANFINHENVRGRGRAQAARTHARMCAHARVRACAHAGGTLCSRPQPLSTSLDLSRPLSHLSLSCAAVSDLRGAEAPAPVRWLGQRSAEHLRARH